jgi:hypothetical protein
MYTDNTSSKSIRGVCNPDQYTKIYQSILKIHTVKDTTITKEMAKDYNKILQNHIKPRD